jgi:hypothetical protein
LFGRCAYLEPEEWKLIDTILGKGSREVIENRQCSRFLAHFALDRLSAWITVVAVLILTFRLTSSISYVALVMLVQVLGRSLLIFLPANLTSPGHGMVSLAAIIKIVALASLILVDSRSDMWWMLISVAVYSIAANVSEASVARMIPELGPIRYVPSINRVVGRIEQFAAVAGPAIAAVVLIIADEKAAFACAAVLAYISLMILRRISRSRALRSAAERWDNPFPPASWRLPGTARVVLAGLAAIAALGMIVRIAMVDVVVEQLGYQAGLYAVLLGIFGLGALAGPLPVDRVLGHFPAELVFMAGVGGLTTAAIIIGAGAPLFLIVPALLASGLAIVTLDLVAAVALRRAVPDRQTVYIEATLVRILVAGHVGGIVVVLGLSTTLSTSMTVLIASSICLLVVGVHFVRVGGFRSTGRIRQVDRGKSSTGP